MKATERSLILLSLFQISFKLFEIRLSENGRRMGSTIKYNFFPLESDYTIDKQKSASMFYSIYTLKVETRNVRLWPYR